MIDSGKRKHQDRTWPLRCWISSQHLPNKPLFYSFKITPSTPHPSYFLWPFLLEVSSLWRKWRWEKVRLTGEKVFLWYRFTSNTSFNKAVYLGIKGSQSIHDMWILCQRIKLTCGLLWLGVSSVEWKKKSYCLEIGSFMWF